jgi:hypothetical protein
MQRIILFGLSLIALTGCSEQAEQNQKTANYSINVKIDSICLKQIQFPEFETSFIGEFRIYNDAIHFIDKELGKIFLFSDNGELMDLFLGRGDGPYEINTAIDGYLNLKSGSHLFLGPSFDLHLHQKGNYERLKNYFLSWEGEQDVNKVRSSSTPNVNQFALYTLDYQNLLLREGKDGNVYFPIYGETQYFNGLNSDLYYEKGKILARMELESGKVKEVLGSRSPRYLENKYLPHHASFSYDIDSLNNFYVSHEIDSLIYKYDQDFELISAFGVKGNNMNTNYTAIKDFNLKLFRTLYFEDRPKLGWYSHVEFTDELGLLFRSYTKGEHSEFDGLQIFKNETLIADLTVPKGFKIKGYIKPYVYGEVISELSEQLKLYKFEVSI